MGLKAKDLIEVISGSPEVQKLIRTIAGTEQAEKKFDDSAYIEKINGLNAELVKYKNVYTNLKDINSQNEGTISDLKTEIAAANKKYESLNGKYAQLLEDSKNETKKNKEEIRRLKAEYDNCRNECDELKKQFSKPVKYLEMYRSLSEMVHDGLENVVCDKDEIHFIASCTSDERLKQIWNYTKNIIGNNGDSRDIEVLKEIFDYFFDLYNESLSVPAFRRDDVEIGDSFDDDKHSRCRESRTSGEISKIIFKGYCSVNTGNIICKSVVKV